jgi:hypothetical protein
VSSRAGSPSSPQLAGGRQSPAWRAWGRPRRRPPLNISGEHSGEGSGPLSSRCMPPSLVAKKLCLVGSPLIGPYVAQASAGLVAPTWDMKRRSKPC